MYLESLPHFDVLVYVHECARLCLSVLYYSIARKCEPICYCILTKIWLPSWYFRNYIITAIIIISFAVWILLVCSSLKYAFTIWFQFLNLMTVSLILRYSTIGNIYYIPVSRTLFPAGGVCCLGQHILAHVCHLQVWFLVTILSYTWLKFSM
jgi:hypothetical protein